MLTRSLLRICISKYPEQLRKTVCKRDLLTPNWTLYYRNNTKLFSSTTVLKEESKVKTETIQKPEGLGAVGKGSAKPRGPIGWRNLALTGAVMGILYAFYKYARNLKEEAIASDRKKVIGKAKLGGSFELLDHTGKLRSSQDFLGQWVMLYFGFTHCPDICPEEMEKVAEVVDALQEESGLQIQPLFITVDPRRDGVKEVAEYVKEFHPRLIGLTGTEDQVREACRAYRVYFSPGPADEDDDYIVDHTIIVYLLNPDGDFVDYYGQTKTADMIKKSIVFHNTKFEAEKKKMSGFL